LRRCQISKCLLLIAARYEARDKLRIYRVGNNIRELTNERSKKGNETVKELLVEVKRFADALTAENISRRSRVGYQLG
jgi:hypothetical protein